MDVILDKIIENKSKELGINKQQGLEIFKSLSNFVHKVIKDGDFKDIDTFKSVYIKDLGTIYPKKDMIKKIQNNITNENI
jgi:Zn-dependent M32 family carboxypeptidase